MLFPTIRTENNIVNDNLVIHLDAGINGSYPGSGTTWNDLDGSNNGTFVNSPTYSDTNGGIISFDGTNRVDVANNASIQLTGAMTIEAWLKGGGSSASASGIGRLGNSGSRGYALLPGGTASPLSMTFYIASSSSGLVSTASSAHNSNNWEHWAGVYDPSVSMTLYKNGVQDSQNTTSIPASQYANSLPFQVGSRGDSTVYFTGSIPVVRLYSRALSAIEIQQNFEATRGRFGI